MIGLILLILLLALLFGGWSYPRYGYIGASPVVIVIVVILLLWAFGFLR